MAYCPKCGGEMDAAAVVCPHCGYDFPLSPDQRPGIAYSRLADIALIVGIICAGLGCLVTVILFAIALFSGNVVQALLFGPLAFFLQLANLVVFVRVQTISNRSSQARM